MAAGCIYYDIQEYIHPIGWQTMLDKPFRDTVEGANKRFDDVAKQFPGMIRLAEVKVLKQRDARKIGLDISGRA